VKSSASTETSTASNDSSVARRYDNSRRAAAARSTRRRIVAAAAELFTASGFAATSVRAISELADTSPETIYATFGTKSAVLQAWIDEAVVGEHDVAMRDLPAVAAVLADPDPEHKVWGHARILTEINERVAVPLHVLRAAASADAKLAEVAAENERRRRADIAFFLDDLVSVWSLRDDLTKERAIDMVAALTSVDLYRALVTEAGWTHDEYATEIVRLVRSSLVARG
jgi:AcrR family transcriptional regulator